MEKSLVGKPTRKARNQPRFVLRKAALGHARWGCALAALVRGITRIRTGRRGLRTARKMRAATTYRARPRKSFLLRSETRREGGQNENAKNSQKGTPANCAAKAARRALRRDAERAAVRDVADTGRIGEADALPAGQHFRPIAAFAQGGIRRLRSGEAAACHGQSHARRGLRNGLGVSAEARDSQEGRESAKAKSWEKSLAANGGSLSCYEVSAEGR